MRRAFDSLEQVGLCDPFLWETRAGSCPHALRQQPKLLGIGVGPSFPRTSPPLLAEVLVTLGLALALAKRVVPFFAESSRRTKRWSPQLAVRAVADYFICIGVCVGPEVQWSVCHCAVLKAKLQPRHGLVQRRCLWTLRGVTLLGARRRRLFELRLWALYREFQFAGPG